MSPSYRLMHQYLGLLTPRSRTSTAAPENLDKTPKDILFVQADWNAKVLINGKADLAEV